MKKKILSLLLVATMACYLCACGGSESTQSNISEENNIQNTDISEQENDIVAKIEFVESDETKGSYYKVYLSEEDFKECLTVVELTADNWSDYFGDYEYTKHIVEENEFGDKKETDILVTGFGAKEGLTICQLEQVSFKIEYDNSDGYLILKYETQFEDGYIRDCLVDGLHMPINNETGKLEDDVVLDVVGKILVFENLPIDISQIDTSKLSGEIARIELNIGGNVIKATTLEYAFSKYYNEYILK